MLKESTLNAIKSFVDTFNAGIAPNLKGKVKYVVMEYDSKYLDDAITKASTSKCSKAFTMSVKQMHMMRKRLDFMIVPIMVDGIAMIHVVVIREPSDIDDIISRMKVGLSVIPSKFLEQNEIG